MYVKFLKVQILNIFFFLKAFIDDLAAIWRLFPQIQSFLIYFLIHSLHSVAIM